VSREIIQCYAYATLNDGEHDEGEWTIEINEKRIYFKPVKIESFMHFAGVFLLKDKDGKPTRKHYVGRFGKDKLWDFSGDCTFSPSQSGSLITFVPKSIMDTYYLERQFTEFGRVIWRPRRSYAK